MLRVMAVEKRARRDGWRERRTGIRRHAAATCPRGAAFQCGVPARDSQQIILKQDKISAIDLAAVRRAFFSCRPVNA